MDESNLSKQSALSFDLEEKMIGIDMAKIARFENKDNLAKKILSSEEYDEYLKSLNKTLYLATSFCVKEAFLKANQVGLFAIPMQKIILKRDENGCPHVYYLSKDDFIVSLSHEGEYVISIVMKKE